MNKERLADVAVRSRSGRGLSQVPISSTVRVIKLSNGVSVCDFRPRTVWVHGKHRIHTVATTVATTICARSQKRDHAERSMPKSVMIWMLSLISVTFLATSATIVSGAVGEASRESLAPPGTCPVHSLEVFPIERDAKQREGYSISEVFRHLTFYTGASDFREDSNTGGLFAHLPRPQHLPFVRSTQHHLQCTDGRSDYAVLAAFGGDVGEFVLALSAVERTRSLDEVFSASQVLTYLRAFLVFTPKQFYFHTDSIHWLQWKAEARKTLGISNPLRPLNASQRFRLLKMAPRYIGCAHLRHMMSDERAYRVRRQLVEHVIHAVLSILMDPRDRLRNRIIFEILEGYAHGEKAFVDVLSPGPGHNTSSQLRQCLYHAPLVVPRLDHDSDRAIAIFHPQAVYESRAQLVAFFASALQKSSEWQFQLFKLLNEIGSQQMRLTKEIDYAEVHTYLARFL